MSDVERLIERGEQSAKAMTFAYDEQLVLEMAETLARLNRTLEYIRLYCLVSSSMPAHVYSHISEAIDKALSTQPPKEPTP